MNKESLISLIYKDLYELKVLANGFSEMKIFPKMLVDLAVDKAKNIADCLQKLPLNADDSQALRLDFAQQPQEVETKKVEKIEEKTEILEEPKIEKEIKITEKQPETDLEQPKVQEVEEKIEILKETTIEEDVVVEILEEQQETDEQIEVAETPPEIIVEQPKIEEDIEQIVEEAEPKIEISVVKDTAQGKVSDLRQAFSIADRFRFQRELFDGNGENFSKSITDFNEMETIEQAQNYITKKLKFDLESHVVQAFIKILKRKLL